MIFAKGAFIEINEERCLNMMHNGVECSHCLSHCPGGAILAYDNHIYLNREKCSGCALCFSDCPTEVFHSKQWDETSIIQDIEDEEWSVTEFFCDRHTLPYKMNKNKDRGAIQLPACLSSISRGAWYESGLKTAIEIHLDQCKGCQLAETIPRLEYNVGMAVEWLEASGYNPAFSYIHQSSQGKNKKSQLAFETGLKVTSRRDLFLNIINKGQRLAGKTPGSSTEHFSGELDLKTQHSYLPDWQRRLAVVFRSNDKASANPAFWPTIKVNDQCVNCGMCSRFCPSGTLQIREDNGICNHYFTSGFCLDCRICQLFCPKEAISRDREKVENPFEVKTIYTVSVKKCQCCGSTTIDQSTDLCFWCREDDVHVHELKESLKKATEQG